MNIGLRTGAWYGDLPAGYRKVKYIQNSVMGCYIDTGVIPTVNTGIKMDAEIVSYNNDDGALCGMCGSGLFAGGGLFSIYVSSETKIIFDIGTFHGHRAVSGYDSSARNVYKLNVSNDGQATITNESGTTVLELTLSKSAPFSYNVWLFVLNVANELKPYYATILRLYAGEMTEGTETIRKFIPVAKVVNGVDTGFLYDKINRKIYGNAGSVGYFIPGPNA